MPWRATGSPDTIEGLNQTSDGTRGVSWRFRLYANGSSAWTPIEYWGPND
jgi:hypothetical protein